MARFCKNCGVKKGIADIFIADLGAADFICEPCKVQMQRDEKARINRIRTASLSVILSTTPSLDGYWVTDYIGIESVEFVIGTGMFSEISSDWADFFGQRSSAFERKLAAAKKYTLDALKFVAAEKGANAVIAVDLDYTEFTGNRIALIANGTLVKVEKAGG